MGIEFKGSHYPKDVILYAVFEVVLLFRTGLRLS